MRTCSLGRGMFLCLMIFFAGLNLNCRDKSPQEQEKPEPNAPAEPDVNVPSESVSQDVAVTVNGVEIKESTITELIAPQLERIDQQGSKLPPTVAE